jgi:hypothetical protein
MLDVCLEKNMEANPEKIKFVAEDEEVRNDEAAVDTVVTQEVRSGYRRLAVRRRGLPKKRSQGDGGSDISWPLPENG